MLQITTHFSLSACAGIVEPIPVGQPAQDYLEQNVNKTLIKALTALCKEKPKDPVVIQRAPTRTITLSLFSFQLWLADKLVEINPYKPKLTQVEAPSPSHKHVR
jgi:nucleoside diphosphate kinase homolog 5